LTGGGTHYSDVELDRTADPDGPTVPCVVVVDGHDPSEIGPRHAGNAGQEPEAKQPDDNEKLLPVQLEPGDRSDGEGHYDEVGESVDAPRGEQMGCLIEAVLGTDGYCPVVGNWTVFFSSDMFNEAVGGMPTWATYAHWKITINMNDTVLVIIRPTRANTQTFIRVVPGLISRYNIASVDSLVKFDARPNRL
jgi:hypothetical protein